MKAGSTSAFGSSRRRLISDLVSWKPLHQPFGDIFRQSSCSVLRIFSWPSLHTPFYGRKAATGLQL